MEEELRQENQLLKSLVATLEHENEARNRERTALLSEIDQLTAEITRLEDELVRRGSRPTNSTDSNWDTTVKELKNLKANNSDLNR